MIALLQRKQQLYRLVGLTSVAGAFGALLAIHLPRGVEINYPPLYALVALTMGSGIALLLANEWLAARPYLFWPIAGLHFPLLEAAAVYLSGGVRSPFFVLFYFSLFFLGMVGGHRGAVLGSVIVGALYVAASVLHGGGLTLDTLQTFTVTLASFYGIAFFAALLGNIAWQEARDASRRALRIAGLNAVNTNLSATLDLHELLEQIPRELCHRLGFARAIVYMLDGDALRVRSGYANDDKGRLEALVRHLREHPHALQSLSVPAEAARTLRPVVSTDSERDARVGATELELSGTRSFAAAPMLAKDELIGVIAADYDQTAHAITEEELILLDTFARMAALAIANNRLHLEAGRAEAFRQLDTLKTEFLSTVSHELRTPLTLVRTSTDLLIDDVSEGLNPPQRQLVETIARNGERLGALVEEILEMAQLEEGRINLNRQITDVRQLVDGVARTLRLMVLDRAQTLCLDLPEEPCEVELDRHRIQQVVTNLVTNACKYTPEGGAIRVRVVPAPETVAVEVRDDGPGIPADKMERVFEKFYRLPDSTVRAKGTGLGLAIARSLVESHGGGIGVSSEPGEGSTFWFRLPRVQPVRIPDARADAAPATVGG